MPRHFNSVRVRTAAGMSPLRDAIYTVIGAIVCTLSHGGFGIKMCKRLHCFNLLL